jgi:hypothetical protein
LKRIRHYIKTGKILPETCYSSKVVDYTRLKNPKSSDRLHYGQYDKKDKAMLALLKKLTGGQFKNGMIARLTLRDFWTKDKAPTFKEFAAAWIITMKEHHAPFPEAAYLTDLSKKHAQRSDWKNLRIEIAKSVIQILNQIKVRQ